MGDTYAGSGLEPTLQAVYDALKADPQLSGDIGGRVYDEVPPRCPLPYVVVGEATTVPWRTHTTKGEEITIVIHIFSRQKSTKEAARIFGHVNRVLGDVPLTVAGYNVVRCYYEDSRTIKEPEGRHIPARYRIQLQEAA